MREKLHICICVLCALLAVTLGRGVPFLFSDGMPQAPGEDVLHLILGDARQELSAAMLEKAEEYFHGGLRDVDCEYGLESCEGHDHEAHDHEAHGHEGHAGEAGSAAKARDPWAWVNRRIHAQEHRHLEGNQSVELLPWIWAACRAAPQNVQAFQTGSYVLAKMAGRPEEGVRLLEEGVRANPNDAALSFSLGELLLNTLKDAARAEPCFVSAFEKCRPADGPGGDDARLLKVRTLFYLGYLAKRRGDLARVRACLTEAEAVSPGHASVRGLRKLLEK